METTIDSVVVEIESSADKADKSLQALTDTLDKLGEIISKPLTALEDLNNSFKNLNVSDSVARKIRNVSDEVKNLNNNAEESNKIFPQFTDLLKRIGKFSVGLIGLKSFSNFMKEGFEESRNYLTNLRLLYSALGDNARKAEEFTENFSVAMGQNPNQILKYLSTFSTLTNSFGIANDEAYTMGRNLTQLSYDLSAYWGQDIEKTLQAVRSGISGEIEPMRRLGVALDQATLQQTAYNLGINQSISTMNRAQKTQLLYYQMMTKTANIQGTLGKTILQPAQQLQVLKNQFTQLARAIANAFIPMLSATIPYIQVLVKWLNIAADIIARFFGFTIDRSGWTSPSTISDISSGIDDIGDSASGATKELKRMLAPFDELNVIEFDKDKVGGGAGGASIVDNGLFDIPLYNYDAISNAWLDKIKEIEDKFRSIKDLVLGIAAGLLTWKIAKKITDFLSSLGYLTKTQAARISLGIALIVTGVVMYYGSIKKMLSGDISLGTVLQSTGSSLLMALGTGIMTGSWTLAGLVFAGTAAFSLGVEIGVAIKKITGKEEVEKGLNEIFDILDEFYDRLKKSKEELQKSISDITVSFGTKVEDLEVTRRLTDSLENYLDVNGRVKEGLEDKVDIILGDLSRALGEEYSRTGDIISINGYAINSYKELKDQVYKLIKARKEQAAEEARYEIYKEYLKQQIKLTNELDTVQRQRNDAEAKAQKILKDGYSKRSNEYKLAHAEVEAFDEQIKVLENNVGQTNDAIAKMDKQMTEDALKNAGIITAEMVKTRSITSKELRKLFSTDKVEWEKLFNELDKTTQNAMLSQTTTIETWNPILQQKWKKLAETSVAEYEKALNELDDITRLVVETSTASVEELTPDMVKKWRELSQKDKNAYNEGLEALPEDTRNKLIETIGKVDSTSTRFETSAKNLATGFLKSLGVNIKADNNVLDSAQKLGTDIGNKVSSNIKINQSTLLSSINNALGAVTGSIKSLTLKVATTAAPGVLKAYANGGYPETGELFYAREDGPELIGRIGNKTTVANNDQIIAGITQGVSAGVAQVLGGTNKNQPVNVYIGNKKVYSGYGEYANTENNMYGKNVIKT